MLRSKKVLLLFAAACLFLESLIILFPASAEETKTDLSEGTSISSVVESPTPQDNIQKLYEQGISLGKISRENYLFEAFKENYLLNKKTYEEMKDLFPNYSSYDNWFAEILNYAAFPDGEGHSPSERKSMFEERASQRENADRFKRDLRKGDIILVSGGMGHAAIATSNNYILEMSGGGLVDKWPTGVMKDNNHQFNKNTWINGGEEQGVSSDKHIKNWVQIWRIPDKNMANKCATYADHTFWNSSGGYTKNRHYDYFIGPNTLSMNPTYCSKLVFHAFWYGSGSAPVMQNYASGLTFIAPNALPNIFTKSYKPYKIGTY